MYITRTYSDLTFDLVTLLLFIFLVVVFLLFIIFFSISIYKSKKFKERIQESSNSMRVFAIDIKNDHVIFFNRASINKKRTSTVTEFYNQFPASEREKLIEWISKLMDNNENPPSYLEINVMISKSQKKYYSLLQIQKIDRKNQILHLESYLFKSGAQKVSSKNVRQIPSSEEKISRALLNNSLNRGLTFAFCFTQKRGRYENDSFTRVAFIKIKDILLSYVTQSRLVFFYSDNQFIIFDLHSYLRSHAMSLINAVKEEINRFLILNSFNDNIEYTVGVVENKLFPHNHEELIKKSIEMANMAKEEDEFCLMYEEGMRSIDLGENQYRSEVERLIRDKKIKYLFRPIYNVDKKKTLGYFSFPTPDGTFFDSIDELKEYAYRTEDDKELFATIATNVISRFNNQKQNDSLRLFFPIRLSEKPHVIKSLSHISKIKETHLVILLDSNDLLNFENNEDEMINDVRTFRVKGYEVALLINERDLNLTQKVYDLFDFFVIGGSLTSALKNSSRARVQLHGLIEKLLSYNHPIIISDLMNWSSVELMVKIGVSLISGEIIAPSEEMILPIPDKNSSKIKAML